GAERRRHFRARRRRDVLAEAQPCTWRSLLIKVAAEVVVSTRRIVVRLSAHWPNLEYFRRGCQRLQQTASPALPSTPQPQDKPMLRWGKGGCARASSDILYFGLRHRHSVAPGGRLLGA